MRTIGARRDSNSGPRRMAVSATFALVALLGSAALATADAGGAVQRLERASIARNLAGVARERTGAPSPTPVLEVPGGSGLVPAPEPVPPAVGPVSGDSFAARFPEHAAASQDPADPQSTRWAVLIGINEYTSGSVADNIGSRQDAEDLRSHLLSSGWRDDHILLLTDRDATGRNITDALRWLSDKTNSQSALAIFHYSGHAKVAAGLDDDPERIDEALWPTDDRFISDAELVQRLDGVDAEQNWISFATCHAAGFADPGLARPGRVLTFSSGEPQKSYEHPDWGNSVWGYSMIEEALSAGRGDIDADGRVSVEEAWAWAREFAAETTRTQRFGPQDAVIVDNAPGEIHLGVPGTTATKTANASPRPAPSPAASPAPDPPPEAPSDSAPRDEPRYHRGRICILCGER